MTFNLVFFLMMAVLLGLIFYSRIYRKKERKLMQTETSYIDAMANFKNTPDEASRKEAINKGLEYGKILGLSETDSEKMVNNDLLRVKK